MSSSSRVPDPAQLTGRESSKVFGIRAFAGHTATKILEDDRLVMVFAMILSLVSSASSMKKSGMKNLLDDDRSLFNSSKLSPILNENLSFIPNTLIIAAELDPIRDHAIAYYEKLLENNVKCELKIIKGVIHGFFRNPNIFKEAFSQLQESIVTFLS